MKTRWWKGPFSFVGTDSDWNWLSLHGLSFWQEERRGRWPRRRWQVVRQFVLLDDRRFLVQGDWFGHPAPSDPRGGLAQVSEDAFRAAERELEVRRRRSRIGVAREGVVHRDGNELALEIRLGGLDAIHRPNLGQGSHIWDGDPIIHDCEAYRRQLAEYDCEIARRQVMAKSPEETAWEIYRDIIMEPHR